jgi:hypothetical protein
VETTKRAKADAGVVITFSKPRSPDRNQVRRVYETGGGGKNKTYSLYLCIPKSYCKLLGITGGDTMSLRLKKEQIVMEKVH